jgi:hypothetical protein
VNHNPKRHETSPVLLCPVCHRQINAPPHERCEFPALARLAAIARRRPSGGRYANA